MTKGLKALKKIEKEMSRLCGMDIAYDGKVFDLFSIVGKELKALEIIKEKPQATLWLIQVCDKKMEYEDMISLFKEDITKEQFELLKEVLL